MSLFQAPPTEDTHVLFELETVFINLSQMAVSAGPKQTQNAKLKTQILLGWKAKVNTVQSLVGYNKVIL